MTDLLQLDEASFGQFVSQVRTAWSAAPDHADGLASVDMSVNGALTGIVLQLQALGVSFGATSAGSAMGGVVTGFAAQVLTFADGAERAGEIVAGADEDAASGWTGTRGI